MIVSGDSFLGKIHNGTVTALCIIGLCKVITCLAHHLPHTGCLDRLVPVVNIIAKIHRNGNVFLCYRLKVSSVCGGCSTGLNRDNSGNVIRVVGCCPAGTAALGMCYQNRILSRSFIYLVNGCSYCLRHCLIVKIRSHIRGHASIRRHLAEELIYRFLIIRELRTFVYNGLSVLPTANSKLCIPSLVQSLRANLSAYGSCTGFSSAGFIDQKYTVSFS